MSIVRPLSMAALCVASAAGAAEVGPRGYFAVETALEIPNVAGPAWRGTRFVCLGAGRLPVPVLGPNNPFGDCAAQDLERTGTALRYRIVCAGRDAARAQARYELRPDGFGGEVAMVLGAKNMTLTERQVGRRQGDCTPAAAAAAQ